MPQVWVSIGSNIQREKHVLAAIDSLRLQFDQLQLSPLYDTPAVGFEGDDFYNMVAGFNTDSPVLEVRNILRRIEDQQGRVRDDQSFASRTLDLDILTYGELIDADLDIPRAEITRYSFVLLPLKQVAGNTLHPALGETYDQLWSEFEGDRDGIREVPIPDFRS